VSPKDKGFDEMSDAPIDRHPNELDRPDPEAIVVGAGAAGLSSAAMLERAGVRSLVLEQRDRIAASWRSRYEGLRLNTLGWMSTQPGYHVGRRPRHFPSREEWIEYLERYARHHRVRIRFETCVERLEREDGDWRVETSRGRFRPRFVVVATGYDRQPKMPAWPGRESFTGELIHSSRFRNVAPYRGRDVLVVSAGVTGSELAFFLAEGGAARVRVAVRTPPTILRRCRFGVPLNPAAVLLDRLPAPVGDRAAALSQWMTFGDLSSYGLPRPRMGAVSSVRRRRVGPAIDDGFVGAVKDGRIEIIPAVEAFEGPDVILAGGERIQPDAVIAATGYNRGLEPLVGHLGVLDERGEPKFLGGETPPDSPGLYFVGYRVRLSGPLRSIRIDARRMARAVARNMHTARSSHE
jgi:putative flavoprotein involved in K+ transport